ncbi:MAG: transposase [Thiotrichales bacterium]
MALPNVPFHIIQRGNNRQACFYADEDYRFYLDWLREHADKTGSQIHAYVLMTNHVHLPISMSPLPCAKLKVMAKMIALDTNVLARFHVDDPADPEVAKQHNEMTVQFRRNDRVDLIEDRAHELRA